MARARGKVTLIITCSLFGAGGTASDEVAVAFVFAELKRVAETGDTFSCLNDRQH